MLAVVPSPQFLVLVGLCMAAGLATILLATQLTARVKQLADPSKQVLVFSIPIPGGKPVEVQAGVPIVAMYVVGLIFAVGIPTIVLFAKEEQLLYVAGTFGPGLNASCVEPAELTLDDQSFRIPLRATPNDQPFRIRPGDSRYVTTNLSARIHPDYRAADVYLGGSRLETVTFEGDTIFLKSPVQFPLANPQLPLQQAQPTPTGAP